MLSPITRYLAALKSMLEIRTKSAFSNPIMPPGFFFDSATQFLGLYLGPYLIGFHTAFRCCFSIIVLGGLFLCNSDPHSDPRQKIFWWSRWNTWSQEDERPSDFGAKMAKNLGVARKL